MTDSEESAAYWRALLHRWFVQYNPTPLLSAAFVLGGAWQLSRAAADDGGLLGQLGVATIAEVYALALIAAAAFLYRLELRRPAVMLGLLAALYQGDATLHVETCAYLGPVGVAASAAWLALFALKVRLLFWALGLRPSALTAALIAAGGAGLAGLPFVWRHAGPETASASTVAWIFGLFAARLFFAPAVDSRAALDVRGRRALAGVWALWGAMALAHAAYWAHEHGQASWALLPAGALLVCRWLERERQVWLCVGAVTVAAGLALPAHLSTIAALASLTLVLRVWRAPTRRALAPAAEAAPPYRVFEPPARVSGRSVVLLERLTGGARARLLGGALLALHVSLWSRGWDAATTALAAPPPTLLGLVALAALCALALHRLRRLEPALPLALAALHLSVTRGWIAAPRGAFAWGASSTAVGFALLLLTVLGAWLARRAGADDRDPRAATTPAHIR